MFLHWVYLIVALLPGPAPDSPGERYIAQMTLAMQEHATESDVERVLALFTADAVYEHPAFGMRIVGLDAMRTGRLRQLGVSRNARADIRGRTRLSDVEAISVELSFEARDEGRWRRLTRMQMMVFEYRDGRIARIIEYWDK